MEANWLLDDLDPDQRRAVTTESNMVAVIAGAGSGKTRVLTRRVAYRILTERADPRHTLVLTFTREAAGELRRRLPRLGLRERVEAGTFHSVMLGVLRQHWIDRRRPTPNVVSDRRRLVVDAIGRAGVDEVVAEIDWAAAQGIHPDRYVAESRRAGRHTALGPTRVAEAYEAYRTLKRQRGIIDLDDVLALGVELLDGDREAADVLRWRYRHLLVDEAQDLNPLQHRLVDRLRQGHDDLFLVGDPAQAIYGFNGADPSLLLDVADRFPGIEIVRLRTNHRCTPQVVDAGAHVLGAGPGTSTTTGDGLGVGIRSSRPDGRAVRVLSCTDEADEARRVAAIVAGTDPGLVRHGGVAVLARTHSQLTGIREALAHAGIEVRRRIDAPGSPHRLAIDAALRQGSPTRLRAWAHDALDEVADRMATTSPGPGSPPAIDGTSDPVPPAIEVATAVLDFLREQPQGDSVALRSWLAATDPFGLRDDVGVDVSTFHASKGREWHTVVVTGVESGLVPHRSASTAAARVEETRLLYVALTRARDELVITWSARRGGYKRRLSPLIETYAPPEVTSIGPPPDLVEQVRKPAQRSLHRDLHSWRATAARQVGVLPEEFCSNAALRLIEDELPTSPEELAEAAGVGLLTARRWFPGLAELLGGQDATPTGGTTQSSRSTTTGA